MKLYSLKQQNKSKKVYGNRIKINLFCCLLFVMILSQHWVNAANDTLWFNAKWALCNKTQAEYYRIPRVLEGNYYKITDYYKSGALQYIGFSPDSLGIQRHGTCTWFYQNGDTATLRTYENNVLEGKVVFFYFGNKPKAILYYKNNLLEDTTTEYYINGITKGVVSYQNGKLHGAFQQFYKSGLPKLYKELSNGNLIGKNKEYYPSGRLKYDHIMLENQAYKSYVSREDNDVEYKRINFENGLIQSVKKVSYHLNDTAVTTMKIENGIEHWQVRLGKNLIFDYSFKGIFPIGTATKYSDNGKTIIEQCVFTQKSCPVTTPEESVKKLIERLEWEEIYSEDNNATCIQGAGFKLDESSKKIPYTITNGVLKYGVDVTNTKFMNRQINIPVITDMALNYFTLEDTFSSLPQPICASKKYEDEEKEQCTINYNGYTITIINGRINVYAFNDLIPKPNELLICYTDLKEPNKIFPFKVGADIQYQFKNNILYTNDFTAFIIQLFKNNLTDLNNYEDAETLQRTMEKIMKFEKNNYFNSWEDSKTK